MAEKRRKMEFEYVDDGAPIWVTYPPGSFKERPISPEKERILRAIEIQELRELLKRHPPRPRTG
jgi:hypothetical protein